MPHTTFAYPFEQKVFGAVALLAQRLAGPPGSATFLLTLNSDGGIDRCGFTEPPIGWHRQCETLETDGITYLFYDPFDSPEYLWLSWAHVAQPWMERMIGEPFTRADFQRTVHALTRGRPLPRQDEFPMTWAVMF